MIINHNKRVNINKLAVVIPYYKIDFFEETLKSLQKQTNKQFQLYIGNDASPDDPLYVINKYFKNEDYKYFYYNENLGGNDLIAQWERILSNVKEEWFMILGDDDTFSENVVESFYLSLPDLEEKDISVLKFRHCWINKNSNITHSFNLKRNFISSIELFQKKCNNEFASSISENIFRRKEYLKYRFKKIPLAWGSDDFAILDFSNYKDIKYVQNAYVNVRIFENSISGNTIYEEKKKKAYNIFRKIVIADYHDKFPNEFVEKLIKEYFLVCIELNVRPSNDVLIGTIIKNNKFSNEFIEKLIKKYFLICIRLNIEPSSNILEEVIATKNKRFTKKTKKKLLKYYFSTCRKLKVKPSKNILYSCFNISFKLCVKGFFYKIRF